MLDDGSGPSRENRDTCVTLVAVLDLRTRPGLETLLTGLPVSGRSGTLVDQFVGTPLDGKVTAKTGSLDGVSGFVGLVTVSKPVAFAFLDNGNFSETAGATLRVKLGGIVGTYPDVPGADALVAVPLAAESGAVIAPAGATSSSTR